MNTAPVEVVMLGAGNRGTDAYGAWALAHPHEMRVTAIVERDPTRREHFASAHGIPDHARFADWRALPAGLAPAAINALPDAEHEESALHLLRHGYHLMLEKPIAPNLPGTLRVVQAARETQRLLMLGYVLRYTPFFSTVRDMLRSGRVGEIVNVEWRENIHALHYAHSYVRGNWAREDRSSPMLLAKASHDLDLLGWLTGRTITRLASFGSLLHYRPEHAPPGAPQRCLDGCPAAAECAFYAPRTYLTDHTGWPTRVISPDLSLTAREEALRSGPYGVCVYHADNNVVDHQVVAFELQGGASGTLTVHGHSALEGRTLRIDGTKATLRGAFTQAGQHLTLQPHDPHSFYLHSEPEVIPIAAPLGMAGGGHGGGDAGLMHAFVNALRHGEAHALDLEVESHVLAFAAEEARRTGQVIDVRDYRTAPATRA